MRRLLTPFLSCVLMAALASPALAQVRPNRFVTLGTEQWGYVQLQGAPVRFPENVWGSGPGAGFRPGLFITILTRDGQPVTQADAAAASVAAAVACEATRRRFDPQARPVLLRRGGLYFPEACG